MKIKILTLLIAALVLISCVGMKNRYGNLGNELDVCDEIETKEKLQKYRDRSSARHNVDVETEESALTFDCNKGTIYKIYNTYLKHNPTLEGKVIFKITVSPAGRVTNVKLVSSELQHLEIENNIAQLIYRFYFVNSGRKEYSIVYPIDFRPP